MNRDEKSRICSVKLGCGLKWGLGCDEQNCGPQPYNKSFFPYQNQQKVAAASKEICCNAKAQARTFKGHASCRDANHSKCTKSFQVI